MSGLLEGIIDPQYVGAVSWIIIGAVALLLIYAAYRVVRLLTSGTFIAGGRNRRTRLAVMDAAAIDDKRRLVLVRRDDVEHLILIGGPTDVVVEQDIRMIAKAARPQPSESALAPEPVETVPETPRPAAAALARPAYRDGRPTERSLASRPTTERDASDATRPATSIPPAPSQTSHAPSQTSHAAKPASQQATRASAAAAPPVSPAPSKPAAETRASAPPASTSRPEPARTGYYSSFQNRPGQPNPAPTRMPASPSTAPSAAKPVASPSTQASAARDLDDTLLQELEDSLDLSSKDQSGTVDKTLDDEMSKLFGELSRDRKQAN